MKILGIDPGSEQSAFVIWDGKKILDCGILDNDFLRVSMSRATVDCVVIEMVASYGMAVGKSIFETVFWIGRFFELLNQVCKVSRVYRRHIKIHFCNSMRAKDSNIRQALIDRFGGKEKAIGKKATPGILYGVKADIWSALSLAIYWQDKQRRE